MTAFTTVQASLASGITDLAGQLLQAANGDTCEVGTQNVCLVVNNGSGASITVTIATPSTASGLAIADATLTVEAGAIGIIPLPMLLRGATGRATVTYSSATSVTAGVVRLVF